MIKDKDIPYRIISRDNRDVVETVHGCLPEGALSTTREENASVDAYCFFELGIASCAPR